MKVKSIKVKNFKSISEQEIDFKGCSAIVTAGNNKGKTSFLRGLIDRVQNEKPEQIIKQGEKDGFSIMELTDGSRFEWIFNEKKEVLNFITKDGFKVDATKGSALKDIQTKFFPSKFDIDLFLNSTPKKQVEILQKLVGIDFTKIDADYQQAYALRTEANRDYERLKAMKLSKPELVEKIDIEVLKEKKQEIENLIDFEITNIRVKNKKLRENWELENEKRRKEIEINNSERSQQLLLKDKANSELIFATKSEFLIEFTDFEKFERYVDCIKIKDKLTFEKTIEPDYLSETIDKSELLEIEKEIEAANEQNTKYAVYLEQQKQYDTWVSQGKTAKEAAEKLNEKVKAIETERKNMIAGAKFPAGFEIVDGEIKVNGFSLSKNQISSSRLYIAALQLASMELGEVKTLHFDCSTLDKNSLKEVENWAKENDLQLLIEKPDFEAGEITYNIINE